MVRLAAKLPILALQKTTPLIQITRLMALA